MSMFLLIVASLSFLGTGLMSYFLKRNFRSYVISTLKHEGRGKTVHDGTGMNGYRCHKELLFIDVRFDTCTLDAKASA